MAGTIRVTQVKSPIRRTEDQRQTLIGLGLNKLHRTRELENSSRSVLIAWRGSPLNSPRICNCSSLGMRASSAALVGLKMIWNGFIAMVARTGIEPVFQP